IPHLVQALSQCGHAPLEPGRSSSSAFVCLPGRIPRLPRPGTLLACRVEGLLGLGEPVTGGVVCGLSAFHCGLGIGEGALGRRQPAPRIRELADRLAAFPRPVCHLMIIPGDQANLARPELSTARPARHRSRYGPRRAAIRRTWAAPRPACTPSPGPPTG